MQFPHHPINGMQSSIRCRDDHLSDGIGHHPAERGKQQIISLEGAYHIRSTPPAVRVSMPAYRESIPQSFFVKIETSASLNYCCTRNLSPSRPVDLLGIEIDPIWPRSIVCKICILLYKTANTTPIRAVGLEPGNGVLHPRTCTAV